MDLGNPCKQDLEACHNFHPFGYFIAVATFHRFERSVLFCTLQCLNIYAWLERLPLFIALKIK